MEHTPKTRRLRCACCGDDAGRHQQWWNQDTGYGVCPRCVTWIKDRGMPDDEFQQTYGKPGVHYSLTEPVDA